jgi:hypothetical protein
VAKASPAIENGEHRGLGMSASGAGRDKAAGDLLDGAGRNALGRHREVRGGLSLIQSWPRRLLFSPENNLPGLASVAALRGPRLSGRQLTDAPVIAASACWPQR